MPLGLGLAVVAITALLLLPGRSLRYIARRVGFSALTVLAAMAVVWVLVHHLPADPPIIFEGDRSAPGGGRALERLFSGGDPTDGSTQFDLGGAMRAYGEWLGDLVSGDLGDTSYSETVTEGLARTIPISLQLLVYSQLLAGAIAIPAALLAVRHRGRRSDALVRATTLVGLSTPVFMVGPVLVFLFAVGELGVFGVDLGYAIFPSGRYTALGEDVVDHLKTMALPSITLAFSTTAVYLTLLRSEMFHQLAQPHAELGAAKGLPDRTLIRRHALRPATPTAIAAVTAQAGALLGNLIIIERIFLLPGFGDYVIIAVTRNDNPAIVGAIFVSICVLVVISLVADALLLAVDPRLRV